jgi:hypothetical protein
MGKIIGKVLTVNKEPISEATVLIQEGPTHPDLAALTNAEGEFSLSNLKPGKYRLEILAEGFIPVQGRVSVRPQLNTRIRVTLEDEFIPEID